jgi:hypothetical protein
VAADDTSETIASKLLKLGYRLASRKYHPDHAGGDTRTMQRITAARDYALTR